MARGKRVRDNLSFWQKLRRAFHDAWGETLYNWGKGDYVTLDCREGQHMACGFCHCGCHGMGTPIDPSYVETELEQPESYTCPRCGWRTSDRRREAHTCPPPSRAESKPQPSPPWPGKRRTDFPMGA